MITGTILLAWLVPLAIIFAVWWHTPDPPPPPSKSNVRARRVRNQFEWRIKGNRTPKPPTLKDVRGRQRVKQLYLRCFGQLPLEIVHQIFTLCLPQTPFILPNPTDAPLLLCQVSRTWRRYAHSNPELWASLYVSCWASGSEGLQSCRQSIHPELMRRWMRFSSRFPISLHLSLGKTYYQRREEASNAFRTIAKIMASQINRFKNLELELPVMEALDSFFVMPPEGQRLRLETLLVDCEEGDVLPTSLYPLLKLCPALCSLTWKSPNVQGTAFYQIVNWVQLVDLHLDCRLSREDCFHIIQNSTQLKTCYLFGICIPAPFSPLMGPHVHSTLQDLRLHSTIPINALISAFTLPCLNILHIIVSDESFDTSVLNSGPELLYLVIRSRPLLRILRLESFHIPEDDLIQCLLNMPTIEEINIDEKAAGVLTDSFLDALGRFWPTSEGDEGGSVHRLTFLCPKLQTIRLGPNISSTDGVFAEMFHKRWNAASNGEVCRPKLVQVEFRNGPHEVDEGIKQYRAEGLSFHFFSSLDLEE